MCEAGKGSVRCETSLEAERVDAPRCKLAPDTPRLSGDGHDLSPSPGELPHQPVERVELHPARRSPSPAEVG